MIDPSQIRAGAGRVYRLAPNIATFLTLSWAALASTDAAIARWGECPGTTKLASMGWQKRAIEYRNELLVARDAARSIVDHAASGNPDWQAAAGMGSAYALALGRFFNGPHALSGGWAELSNGLEEIGCKPPAGPWEQAAGSTAEGLQWLSYLIAPWTAATAEATEYVVRNGGDLEKMGTDAKAAVDTYFKNPLEYAAKAASGIATAVVLVVGLWFGWPFIAPLFGLAAKKTGEA